MEQAEQADRRTSNEMKQLDAMDYRKMSCRHTITADLPAPGTTDQTIIMVRTPDSTSAVTLPIVNDTLHIGLTTLSNLLKMDSWELQCVLGELVEISVVSCEEISWKRTATPWGNVSEPDTIPVLKAILVTQSSKSLNSGMVVAWLKDVMRGWLDEKMRGVGR